MKSMLIYTYIDVPAGTQFNNAVSKTLELPTGVIKRIRILFPWGVNCTTYIQLRLGENVILPREAEEWVTASGGFVEDEPYLEVTDKVTTLKILGAAPEAKYDHRIHIYILILDAKYVFPERALEDLLRKLLERLVVKKIVA